MSLYLPRAFDMRELASLDTLAAAYPFAMLCTVHDGEPFVSHVPVLYRRDGDRIAITGHLARPNPQAGRSARGVVVLRGPQAYVSPGWYVDKAEQARVPTWNYVVAHLSGAIEWFDDAAMLGDLVARLGDVHETVAGGGWRFDMENPAEWAQLRGIVGFRVAVDRVEFKAKLSQNHPEANRRAVVAKLDASPDADAREIASWMRATLPDELQGA